MRPSPPERSFIDRILPVDVRDYCRMVPAGVADMVVTSPPYFRQRVYEGVAPSIWGGSRSCKHKWLPIQVKDNNLHGGRTKKQSTHPGSFSAQESGGVLQSATCLRCSAWMGCLGNEPTVRLYTQNMVEVFRGVYHVLRDQGILWLNLDTKYNGSGGAGGDYNQGGSRYGQARYPALRDTSYRPKELIPVPWLVAIALHESGWLLRVDGIWHKPNSFTQSARDRPSRDHEYLLLFSKQPRYWYDQEATKVPAKYAGDKRSQRGDRRRGTGMNAMHSDTPKMRNLRTVMSVTTKPSRTGHYATYNAELIEPLIRAGAPEGGVVFDPFMGTGATALAARALGRHFIGCDASEVYVKKANRRLK